MWRYLARPGAPATRPGSGHSRPRPLPSPPRAAPLSAGSACHRLEASARCFPSRAAKRPIGSPGIPIRRTAWPPICGSSLHQPQREPALVDPMIVVCPSDTPKSASGRLKQNPAAPGIPFSDSHRTGTALEMLATDFCSAKAVHYTNQNCNDITLHVSVSVD